MCQIRGFLFGGAEDKRQKNKCFTNICESVTKFDQILEAWVCTFFDNIPGMLNRTLWSDSQHPLVMLPSLLRKFPSVHPSCSLMYANAFATTLTKSKRKERHFI